MKKVFSILLAVVMIFSLTITAFAADNAADEEGKGSAEQAVTAEYAEESEDKDVATVYLVTVDWKVESTLKYSDGKTTFTWNANETKYEANTEDKGWTGEAAVEVTVTNKSNAEVTATASWKNAGEITAACTFKVGNEEKNAIEVASAAKDVEIADGKEGAAKTGTITAEVAAPTAGTIAENNATVGTITVNIAPVAESTEP